MTLGFLGQGFLLLSALSLLGQVFTGHRKYAYACGALIAGAMGIAFYAHLTDDFSILNVFMTSHTAKPLLYKIAGVWGSHEGSMLLWVFIMAVVSILLLRSLRSLPEWEKPAATLLGLINFGFIGFMLAACDPFQMLAVPVEEGLDLNPLLQDPSLAFHPPILYTGYVTFLAPFIIGVVALLKEDTSLVWASLMRPWVQAGWVFLSLGLALGSFWAYYELGWGGWWFWDPVESAALVPWLLATALIHTLHVVRATGSLKTWSVCLSFLTFGSCLLGTFLVRSGLLTSVHSFAVDPLRGLIILFLTGMILGSAFFLLAKKSFIFKSDVKTDPRTRSGVLLINTLFLVLGAGTVCLGIIYPLILETFGQAITVGAPFYNATFVPLMILLLFLMGIGIWISWKKGTPSLIRAIAPTLTISMALSLGIALYLNIKQILAFFALLAGMGVIVSTCHHLLKRKKWGMGIAHLGLGISVLGMTLSTSLEQEAIVALKPGETHLIGDYKFTFVKKKHLTGPNYDSEQAILRVEKEGRKVTVLTPEKRSFWTQKILHSETSIHYTFLNHLYAAIGENYKNGSMSFRLYYKPFIGLLWIGWIIMIFGGAISLFSRMKKVVFVLLVLNPNVWATQAHEVFQDPLKEQMARELRRTLLCPVCGGQSLDESPSPVAEEMRYYIRQKINDGWNKERITQELVARYGAIIITKPPFSSSTLLLWFGPWMALFIIGGFIVLRFLKNERAHDPRV